MQQNNSFPDLLTPSQLVDRYPWLTKRRLQNWLFNRERNGLKAAVVTPPGSRLLLIDEAKFLGWVLSIRE